MAEIFIYSSLDLREARGNLEDDLEEFLEGIGETTGGGGGMPGWNVDLKIHTDEDLSNRMDALLDFLRKWGVPPDTYFEVYQDDDYDEQEERYKNPPRRYNVFSTATLMEDLVYSIKSSLAALAKRVPMEEPDGWQAIKQDLQKTF